MAHQMFGGTTVLLQNLDADKVLERFGKFGRYQICVYMMACINFFVFSYVTIITSLIGEPNPNCTMTNNNSISQTNGSQQATLGSSADHWHVGLASHFNIDCDNQHLLDHASGAFMIGIFLNTPLSTYLADRYGRRLTFLIALWLLILFSVGCALAPSFLWFLLFRFLSGTCGAAITAVGFVLTVESVAGSFRSIQALLNSLVWVAGIVTVGALHIFISDWRLLYVCIAVPGLFTVVYYWVFPESLHWLVAHKKTKEVRRYISRSSRINGITLNLHSCQSDSSQQQQKLELGNGDLDLLPMPATGSANDTAGPGIQKRGFTDLVRSPALAFHLLFHCYIYVVLNFVYWVLTLHSVELHQNKMVGFFLSAVVEVPAGLAAMLLLFYFGRRTVTVLSLAGQALSLSLTIFFPQGSTANLVLSLLAKVFNGVSWASEPLLLSEMAPTTVRNMFFGIICTAGEIGSVLAPYLDWIGNEDAQKMFIASMSILAIFVSITTPETSGKPLPQDLEDFESGPFVRLLGRCWLAMGGASKARKTNSRTGSNGIGGEPTECHKPLNEINGCAVGGIEMDKEETKDGSVVDTVGRT